MRGLLVFVSLLAIVPVRHSMAQQPLSAKSTVGVSDKPVGKFYFGSRNEAARAIEFREGKVRSSDIMSNINTYLDIPAEFTFVEEESSFDGLGMRHRLVRQHYKGLPLEGLAYRIHEKGGFVTSMNGKGVREIRLKSHAVISEEQAFHTAIRYLHSKDSVFRPANKLIVSRNFSFSPESFVVAFQFDIDVSLIERWRISIDAESGNVINKVSLVNTCNARTEPVPSFGFGSGITNYYGARDIRVEQYDNSTLSRLVGRTDNGVTIGTYDFRNVSILSLLLFFEYSKAYDFYSSNNRYDNMYHRPAVSVQWAVERAHDYYLKKHDRNSFDNNGATITSYVHVDQDLNNAFWTGKLLAFGDGSDNNPLVELDVVSHELTHGVTQYEAGLQYYNESGALNESFSDILGKAVEFDVFRDTATWQLAKHFRPGGLRDLSSPNLKNQPDTYSGDMWYTGYEDSGGVHTNSGVQNFWFYLLSQGGSGVNDQQIPYSINAIGMEAAAKISYRNLTEYLASASDYLDSRIGSLLATADLYGKNSAEYTEVDKAWDAVGVIDEPIITSLEVYDVTATTVRVKGSLLPRGETVTYHFEYGPTPAMGSTSEVYTYTNTVAAKLTGLQSETKYYLRLVGTNENGSSYYSSEFTTISLMPMVKIKQTVDVTETGAILYGEVNPNSLPTSFYFEYGPTPELGLTTPVSQLIDTTEFLPVSSMVTGLQRRTTYYYKLKATNGFSSASTDAVSFFTAGKPLITSITPVSAPVGAEVIITGQNFNPLIEKNVISFGATRAAVTSISATELRVKVPKGASFGPVTLWDQESGLTARSVEEFVPTFTGEFKKTDLNLTMGISDINIYNALVQDMDGDNKPDIVASHYLGFSVFQNVNQGGIISSESFVRSTFNSDVSPWFLRLADVDGNGMLDVIGYYQNGLRIYPNLSVPGYVFFGPPVDLPETASLQNIHCMDFDNDGRTDIAGTVYSQVDGYQFVIFRNQNPQGSLSAENLQLSYVKNLSSLVRDVSVGDLNNDGAADVLIGLYGTENLSLLVNHSRLGSFDFNESATADGSRGRYVNYIAADLNNDKWKDIAGYSPYEVGNLAVFENKKEATGILTASPVIAFNGEPLTTVQPGDINGDGKVDMVAGTSQRELIYFRNNTVNSVFSGSSFEKFSTYGMTLSNTGSGTVETQIAINDLNGDGRPEIVTAYSYNYGPHDGYEMEIWQNAPPDCPDPSLIRVNASNYDATVVLPPNTSFDDFEIDFKLSTNSYWSRVSSTTFYVWPAGQYQLRARAKCYLGFTEYYYVDFVLDCVDMNSFSIGEIGVNTVSLSASDLNSFEVQYSVAGQSAWQDLEQYQSQITNLISGTKYDLRFRGRCYTPTAFQYKQFTTLCPRLSSLTVTNVMYDRATVNWTSAYTGKVILEISEDNISWKLIDATQTASALGPAKKYFVRGKMICSDSESDFSFMTFTTPCPQVAALYVNNITPFSASINWTDDSGSDSFILTYAVPAGSAVKSVETSSTSFELVGLSPGTLISVAVAPQCTGSREFKAISFTTICFNLVNFSVENVTHTGADLSWDNNFNAVPYSVDYSIFGSNKWLTHVTSSTSQMLTNLRPGTKYEARVHITCLSETAPYKSLLFETELYDNTTYSPNPTSGAVVLRPSKDLIGNRFIILNNSGQIITSGELLDYTIDLSDFSPGMYIMRIEGEKPIKLVKL